MTTEAITPLRQRMIEDSIEKRRRAAPAVRPRGAEGPQHLSERTGTIYAARLGKHTISRWQ
jgi:hypothetical protein